MQSVASEPRSYAGERLRIAPVVTNVSTGGLSSRSTENFTDLRLNYFQYTARFPLSRFFIVYHIIHYYLVKRVGIWRVIGRRYFLRTTWSRWKKSKNNLVSSGDLHVNRLTAPLRIPADSGGCTFQKRIGTAPLAKVVRATTDSNVGATTGNQAECIQYSMTNCREGARGKPSLG